MTIDILEKPKRNHLIAVKTCRNFSHRHYPRLAQCCSEVLKQYRYMSIEIATGEDTKANRWAFKYARYAGKVVRPFQTPQEMIQHSDALILFGSDTLLERLETMAIKNNVKVYRFTVY